MEITCSEAKKEDAETLYLLCKSLIDEYEDTRAIDYGRVLAWVKRKIDLSITEYVAVLADGELAGYYRFGKNADGEYELDDLYVLPAFQGRGIGTAIIRKCCASVDAPVMLYVFIKNQRAVALYERLGFRVEKTVGNSRYIMRRLPR